MSPRSQLKQGVAADRLPVRGESPNAHSFDAKRPRRAFDQPLENRIEVAAQEDVGVHERDERCLLPSHPVERLSQFVLGQSPLPVLPALNVLCELRSRLVSIVRRMCQRLQACGLESGWNLAPEIARRLDRALS